jgi:hypothetical protein
MLDMILSSYAPWMNMLHIIFMIMLLFLPYPFNLGGFIFAAGNLLRHGDRWIESIQTNYRDIRKWWAGKMERHKMVVERQQMGLYSGKVD